MTETSDNQLTLIEILEMWPVLSADERVEAFEMLGREVAQEFFLALSASERSEMIFRLPEGEKKLWMRLLPPDDAADIIQKAPEDMRTSLVALLDDNTQREVSALLLYRQDVAGGLMNPRFARIQPDVTADEAIRYLRLQAQGRLEGIYYVLVLDEEQRLIGIISFQDLFRAAPDKKIRDIMKTDVVTVTEDEDQEVVSKLFTQYKFLALPVVDAQRRIKGVITADDILRTVQAEASEDIQKMGGMEALERPYMQIGFFQMLKKRAGWLVFLFLGEMLTASAMSHFEQEIARAVVLALFVPLIISSGGNTGSQATTLIIRALALGEFQLNDWWKIVYRELGIGLGLGLILSAIGFIRILVWQSIFHLYGPHYLLVAASVSLSLIGVVVWGTLAGSMLPFVLKRLGFDPASASAPFVATLVDVSGIVIYFTVSALILHGTLL
ncbi:MAG TPA: magnesium transporter [Verrucomicrobiae bacterium]|jgi:magnesium transporter|nr:magnesium transporter [Verrucomicrobiae bacterium]